MLNLLSPKDLNLHPTVVTHSFGSQNKVRLFIYSVQN